MSQFIYSYLRTTYCSYKFHLNFCSFSEVLTLSSMCILLLHIPCNEHCYHKDLNATESTQSISGFHTSILHLESRLP